MSDSANELSDLESLVKISHTLSRAVDVRTALQSSLQQLIQLMGLETGWIFIRNAASKDRWAGRGYELAAYCQLPPALDLESRAAWDKGCNCQALCRKGELNEAYNEVKCSRLAESTGERHGLTIHASTPLQSKNKVLGILNVAAPDWNHFDERALALLTSVGEQMGVTLERAQLHEMLSIRRAQEQSTLLLLSEKLLKRSSIEGLDQFIVHETCRLLELDACALLLPDPNEQACLYFMAETGWHSDPVGAGRQVSIDAESWVGKAMISHKPFVAKVAKENSSGALDHWAMEEGFKIVSAVPLVVDGHAVGVMVVHSRRARDFDDADLRFLQLLANQAAIAMEERRLLKEELEWAQTERELTFGREVQRSMLPESCPQIPGWQFAVTYRAARQVGGDFYDFFPFLGQPELWSIVIADVSDKGVPAALYMVLSRTTIRNTAHLDRSPAEVLQKTNQYILEDSQADMFLSAFYANLDTISGRLSYSNAGHNYPLWWQSSSATLATLSQHGMLLGVVGSLELTDYSIDVMPGDLLVLYTDGITEAINDEQEEFGEERLKNVIQTAMRTNPDLDGEGLIEQIIAALSQFTAEQPIFDDETLFVVKRLRDSNG